MDDTRVQQEINKYKKFKKVDGATYRKVNQFLRKRTYITAREWALARLCTDFRTSGGAEMTFIGQHLPELVPFMEDTYSPQAVNQARNSFKKKVRKASSTFFYGAMCGFFTTDELDDLLFEASEVARFLLEVEGTTLDIDEEIDIEDRITQVMRGVGEAAKTILKARGEDIDLPDHTITDTPTSIERIVIAHTDDRTSIRSRDPPLTGDEEIQTAIETHPESAFSELPSIAVHVNSLSPHETPKPDQSLPENDTIITDQEITPNNAAENQFPENRQFRTDPEQPRISDGDKENGASP